MKSKILLSVLCFALLSSGLLLKATDDRQETQIYLSEIELQEIFNNPKRSYVYIGKEVSDIAGVIAEISKLDDNKNSLVWGLANHVEKGFVIGNYEAVAQALEQAEIILNNHADLLDQDKVLALSKSLNNIIEQVIEDKLSLDAELLSFLKDKVEANAVDGIHRGLRLLVINEKMHVHGRTKFYKDVTFTHDVKFKDDVTIEGTLSVADEIIGCDLTVGCNINLNDSTSATVGNIVKNGIPFMSNFGTNNTFLGANAGNFVAAGSDNVGLGANALAANTDDQLVAVGSGALQNFVNGDGGENVAVGYNALNQNTVGNSNTAVGWTALELDVTTTTGNNTAIGWAALSVNTTGTDNTAIGNDTMSSSTIGINNVAVGSHALNTNTTGTDNIALGLYALGSCLTGSNNIGIGSNAGSTIITGSNNIYIGADAVASDESGVTRIANISGTTTGVADAVTVVIDSTGQLGTISSTRRVKHNIQDMNDESAAIYNLRPVTFAYNSDVSETKQYGLIAEEVDQVFPAIVTHNRDGQAETVQYHVLPTLILNELQKLAARVAVLEARS